MKTRGIAAGLALLLGAVLMTGCRAGETTITYDNGDAYTAGGTSLAKAIDSVEIHWSAGSVLVMSGQYETISFSEDRLQGTSTRLSNRRVRQSSTCTTDTVMRPSIRLRITSRVCARSF